ncbi:SDR family oxidoreductase [Streptomyces aidingensis]|uniref:NADP-dependent 3-hydroxy acid dehydrogenase YdfG n=1 Tax=Streptomyces aidingensis TaxID=910347 RepID=A0A1I1ULE6_9ACTN|nr:SDR family oxidoreductase [Streptomyces aidingensis]SFD69573.1 NADP-dependent 3-hydroxy acid dehydrogenase YdfG [Streptomyces aidingensis]
MSDKPRPGRRTVLGTLGLAAAAGLGTMPVGEAAARERTQPRRHPQRRVVLITGCSSGFGHLTALTLARAGHRVFASMRHRYTRNAGPAAALLKTARREGLALEVVEIDITDERSVEHGVRRVRRRAGRIDVLFNNAGIFSPAVLETLTVEELKKSFDTNLFGHLRMNRAVLPLMRDQGEGLVVQMTTALGRFVLPFMGSYIGAKWALEAMTESCRYELAPFGVEFVIVEPGAYLTGLLDNGARYYRQYLDGLSREDARRRRAYGELAERAEAQLLPDGASPEPQEIADAVALMVRTPHGERPIRLAGPGFGFLDELNALSQGVAAEAIRGSGWDDLLSIAPAPAPAS